MFQRPSLSFQYHKYIKCIKCALFYTKMWVFLIHDRYIDLLISSYMYMYTLHGYTVLSLLMGPLYNVSLSTQVPLFPKIAFIK